MNSQTPATRRVALYLRVSTADQTVENQRRELEAAVDRHPGWQIVGTFTDEGVSGGKGRDKRPGFDALWKAVSRREIDMVAVWSVDRLGRSLQDLVAFLGDLNEKGVDIFLLQQGLDSSTASGRAMFQMLGVFSEFERAMIRERVNAGLARARAAGKTLGRRTKATDDLIRRVGTLRGEGYGLIKIAKTLGVGTGTVQKIVAEKLGNMSREPVPPAAKMAQLDI